MLDPDARFLFVPLNFFQLFEPVFHEVFEVRGQFLHVNVGELIPRDVTEVAAFSQFAAAERELVAQSFSGGVGVVFAFQLREVLQQNPGFLQPPIQTQNFVLRPQVLGKLPYCWMDERVPCRHA